MMKQLVWVGKIFPNRLVVANALVLLLIAYGAPAIQKCDCPCATPEKKPVNAALSPAGQVTIVWPRPDNFLASAFHSKIAVQIDADVVGTVDFDAPLTVSVPNGPHKLVVKQKSGYLETITKTNENEITASAQKPLYFKIIDNGLSVAASEVDDATAQALLSGSVKNSWQAAPSGTGTVYFYWPKSGPDLGFFSTDLPAYLDGKRIGVFTNGDYFVMKTPSGEHVLSVDMSRLNGPWIKKSVILVTGSTQYFHVEKLLDFHIIEDSPEQASEFTKNGLRQREASAQ